MLRDGVGRGTGRHERKGREDEDERQGGQAILITAVLTLPWLFFKVSRPFFLSAVQPGDRRVLDYSANALLK